MNKDIPRIISVSGSVHSGKTTITRMLACRLPNAFYLDGDLISAFVGQGFSEGSTIDDMLPEVHDLIIQLIRASLHSGLDIIVDYPFDDTLRKQITDALKDLSFQAKWFLLKPATEKVLSGSLSRPQLNDWEIERIKYHYNSPLMSTSLAIVIDSTNQTPEETLEKIMEAL